MIYCESAVRCFRALVLAASLFLTHFAKMSDLVRRSCESMTLYSRRFAKLVQRWPGKKTLGMYRFLPLFFVMGGALEWFMIHANIAPGGETFYDVYRRREAEQQYEERLKPEGASIVSKCMPAGVDWFPYLRVAFASFLSALAGSQVVHMYYKPDLTIPETPPLKGELANLRKSQQQTGPETQQPPQSESATEN